MIIFEDELRAALADRVAGAPTGDSLLAGAKARSRRRTARRRVAVAGAAVLVVGAGAVSAPALVEHWSDQAGPTIGAGPSVSATARLSVSFAPGGPDLPTFPYTPRWEPPTLGERQSFIGADGGSSLQYHNPAAPQRSLTVRVSGGAAAGDWADRTALTVRGRAATLFRHNDTGTGSTVTLTWEEEPGVFIELVAADITQADLLRYAEELARQPLAVQLPFSFALNPIGLALTYSSPGEMGFTAPGMTDPPALGVAVREYAPTPGASPTRVGGRAAELSTAEGYRNLAVDLGDGRMLVVTAIEKLGVSDDALVRFAAGVTVLINGTGGRG